MLKMYPTKFCYIVYFYLLFMKFLLSNCNVISFVNIVYFFAHLVFNDWENQIFLPTYVYMKYGCVISGIIHIIYILFPHILDQHAMFRYP